MLKVGVTGGIGSGKSTVCRIFSQLGVPVYNADDRAKWLVAHDDNIRQAIMAEFGELSFEGGIYNRPYMASIVFNDAARLEKLNRIIHPVVLEDWESFCRVHASSPYVVKEAAIMLEAGGRDTIDYIILVSAPEALRISRLLERDGLTREDILSRMNKQMPEEDKIKLADHVIYNDQEHSLIEQVMACHHQFTSA
jgi:dephospho-CoA kinase